MQPFFLTFCHNVTESSWPVPRSGRFSNQAYQYFISSHGKGRPNFIWGGGEVLKQWIQVIFSPGGVSHSRTLFYYCIICPTPTPTALPPPPPVYAVNPCYAYRPRARPSYIHSRPYMYLSYWLVLAWEWDTWLYTVPAPTHGHARPWLAWNAW